MKENNSLENNNLQSKQNSFDVHNLTFKIIKKRAQWTKEEDETLFELVEKYGTVNWPIVSKELNLKYHLNKRTGKQCRERWHNNLAPNVNKDNWSEEEENILFSKHLEFGNKWAGISQYLPGRTDNSIKNHFYSKLRKYIRKILKQIHKENLLKNNGIDSNKYNGEKIYKLFKKYNITYKNLTKNTILEMILANEKKSNSKFSLGNNKIDKTFDSYKSDLLLEEEDEKGNSTGNIVCNSINLNYIIGNYAKSNMDTLQNENNINNELFKNDIIMSIQNEISDIKYPNNLDNLNENKKNDSIENKNKDTKKKKIINIHKNVINNNKIIGKKKKRKRKRKPMVSFKKKIENPKSLDKVIKSDSSIYNIINDNTNSKKLNESNFSKEENTLKKVSESFEILPSREIKFFGHKLLKEDLFTNNDYHFIPKVNINIPITPRVNQNFSPSFLSGDISNKGMFNMNFSQNYNDNKNFQVNDLFEQTQISNIGFDNNLIRYPSSVKSSYSADLGNEINFLKNRNSFIDNNKNDNSFSNLNYGLYNFMTPRVNKEIHLFNKIFIPNNIDNQIHKDMSFMQSMNNSVFNNPFKNNNKKEIPAINLDLINQTGFSNSFCGNESLSISNNNDVSNLLNLSNYSPNNFPIPKNHGNEQF